MKTHDLRAAGVRFVLSAVVCLTSVPAAAQAVPQASRTGQGPHVRVELVVDRESPGPGMRLGLVFDLDPGWHVYWQNPGDSGGAPEITWTLPAGMKAVGIEWPTPERIDIGGLVNYGYHGRVTLPVPVAVAAGARTPPDLFVNASVRWVACATMCVPGKAELALRFPLRGEERAQVPAWSAAIDAARARVPTPAPPAWSASATTTERAFVLDVQTGTPETGAVFFPLDVSQVNDSAPQVVSPLPTGVRLTLAKSGQLVHTPAVLRGVLTFPDGRAHAIEAPVR
jgi:thiol:disulfide interchange protein DsbD